MFESFLPLLDGAVSGRLLSSLALGVLFIVIYGTSSAAIRRTDWETPESQRRWLVMIRNVAVLLFLLCLVVVWAAQLRTLALSVVGFAVAIVLVTKEWIMCATGGFIRSSSGIVRIGDRIELKGLRGEVIDLAMLTTKIMEIGPDHTSQQMTGRMLIVPNSIFLTEAVFNENLTSMYGVHSLTVPLPIEADWRKAERHLLLAAEEICSPYLDSARRHIGHLNQRQGIDVPSVDPRVGIHLANAKEIHLILRFPYRARQKSLLEQSILRRYLELNEWHVIPGASSDTTAGTDKLVNILDERVES